jgi:hypothetical protein
MAKRNLGKNRAPTREKTNDDDEDEENRQSFRVKKIESSRKPCEGPI